MPVLSSDKTDYVIKMEPLDVLLDGVIRIQGDTAINQLDYKKVFILIEPFGEFPVGFVREDAVLGKMWMLYESNNQEYLIMNLELGAGDVFNTSYMSDCGISGPGGSTARVAEITEVENRKVIVFDRGFGGGYICDSLKFIEGIGPNATLFFQNTGLNSQIAGLAYKICRLYQEDTLSFPLFSAVDLCGSPTAVPAIGQPVAYISIMPNPNDGIFLLKRSEADFKPSDPVVFIVFDLMGKAVASVPVGDTMEQRISFTHLPAGLYSYRISVAGKFVQAGKIMVE